MTTVGALRVTIRLFAMQRELAGTREVALAIPDGATIEDAWEALVARFPTLAGGRPYVRFARNGAYAEPPTALADGDEVAVIPPVSGGGRAGRVRLLELTGAPIDDARLAALRAAIADPRDGACVTFLGLTRETPGRPAPGQEAEAARHAGKTVERLGYEAFEPLARRVLEEIAGEIETRFGVTRLAIVHRTGEVPVGEASVAIAAGAPHRGEAFEACRYAIEELKARAPIWKAERFADGSVWVGRAARPSAAPSAAPSADLDAVPSARGARHEEEAR